MRYSSKPMLIIASTLFYSGMIFPVGDIDFQDKDSPLQISYPISKKYNPIDNDTKQPLLQKKLKLGQNFIH